MLNIDVKSTEQRQRLETVKQIADATDALNSVTVPKGSIEDTTAFLDNLFTGTYERFENPSQHIHS